MNTMLLYDRFNEKIKSNVFSLSIKNVKDSIFYDIFEIMSIKNFSSFAVKKNRILYMSTDVVFKNNKITLEKLTVFDLLEFDYIQSELIIRNISFNCDDIINTIRFFKIELSITNSKNTNYNEILKELKDNNITVNILQSTNTFNNTLEELQFFSLFMQENI